MAMSLWAVRHICCKAFPKRFLRSESLRKVSSSQETVSAKTKALLKENINCYLDNHEYTVGAVEAVGIHGKLPAEVVEKLEMDEETPLYGETFSSQKSSWRFFWCRKNDDRENSGISSITSSVLFEKGYDALARYVQNESLNPSVSPAFAALERFFKFKEKHEKSLRRLRTRGKMSETIVASLLAQHLLAQLLPHPSNYFLDRYSPGKPDGCPCGCGKPIHFGLTQLGSPQLFYGRADIVLFPTNKNLFFDGDNSKSALFVLKKKSNEIYGHRRIEDDWDEDNDVDNGDISTGECKLNTINGDDMVQLFRQAISISLCKHKKNMNGFNDLNDSQSRISMIPVCGVTKNSFCMVAYDAENDYLLRMCNEMKIFDDNSIRFSALLDLWLLIHHDLFCTKPPLEVLGKLKGTCNLIPQLGPERYASILKNSKWLYQAEGVQRHHMPRPDDSELVDLAARIKKYPRSIQAKEFETDNCTNDNEQ